MTASRYIGATLQGLISENGLNDDDIDEIEKSHIAFARLRVQETIEAILKCKPIKCTEAQMEEDIVWYGDHLEFRTWEDYNDGVGFNTYVKLDEERIRNAYPLDSIQ